MNPPPPAWPERFITGWIAFVERCRLAIIAGVIGLTFGSILYIKDNLGMSADTDDMLSAELDWRKRDIEYERLFPQFVDNILIVVESATPDEAADGALRLARALAVEPDWIKTVYYPPALPFFRQSAFLFLAEEALRGLADRLAEIQPLLGVLLRDYNLRGLLAMLDSALQAIEAGEDIAIEGLLEELNRALEDQRYQVSWQRLMSAAAPRQAVYREFILLRVEPGAGFLPGAEAIRRIRAKAAALDLARGNTTIRLTGDVALANEELQSVAKANITAIVASLILVGGLLLIGLGSGWLVGACLVTLLMGLIATTAFATLTVGELNLISVAFAVLYIGLGIDFAIHLTLRYREQILLSKSPHGALKTAAVNIFRSLALCALTTAIGFYAFIPTDYEGVAELGWIAGSGMFISVLYTFLLLPALLSLKPCRPRPASKRMTALADGLSRIPYRYPKPILLLTALLGAAALSQAHRLEFDFNPLNLQDPENESVQTWRELLSEPDNSPWHGLLLKRSSPEAARAAREFAALAVVDDVIWLPDLIPENQPEKLLLIDEMNLFIGPLEAEPGPGINNQARIAALRQFLARLEDISMASHGAGLDRLAVNLNRALLAEDRLAGLERRMLGNLNGRLQDLNDALAAGPVGLGDLPEETRGRWLNDGVYKLQLRPREDLNDNAAGARFVRRLQAKDAAVTGAPVIRVEAGRAVIAAFAAAFGYALLAITLLLLLLLRAKRDAVLILLTVLTGGVFTVGLILLFNIPLNFANIIGLPLLLGIGVDSAIHISDRFRQEQGRRNIFKTSATRGVIVSSLTTVFSIGNLAFSAHLGTASLGLLLATGLIAMMIATLLVLPAFLIWRNSPGGQYGQSPA